jgi:hypothetical protein
MVLLVLFLGLATSGRPASAADQPEAGNPITGVFVDVSRLNHDAKSNGDTWDHIWTDDNELYSFACDSRGYFTGDKKTNLNFNKSSDKGRTWTRDVKANYAAPMWTSRKFSTAVFFHYGQNGGSTKQDEQDRYVYAISNDGYWNCGTNYYLGRVLRTRLGNLNVADWQYLSNGHWSEKLDDATPVPGFPNGQMKCTTGSPVWLAGLKKYVTVTWYDPGTTTKWHYPENVSSKSPDHRSGDPIHQQPPCFKAMAQPSLALSTHERFHHA